MKFTVKDFSGYSADCSIIKTMLEWAGDGEFTMTQFAKAFPTYNIPIRAMEYLKPKKLKEYLESYTGARGKELVRELEERYAHEYERIDEKKSKLDYKIGEYDGYIKRLSEMVKDPQEYIDRIEDAERTVEHYKKAADMSPPCKILRAYYNATTRGVTRLNPLLHGVLSNCIKGQITFGEDDIKWIFDNCGGGYWFGQSSNGKSYGETFYLLACIYNSSATVSFEKFANRVPFILAGNKLFDGAEFKLHGIYYTVTGWNKDGDMTCVGYQKPDKGGCESYKKRGKRTLMKFNRKDWLEERKSAQLLTSYDINGNKYARY